MALKLVVQLLTRLIYVSICEAFEAKINELYSHCLDEYRL